MKQIHMPLGDREGVFAGILKIYYITSRETCRKQKFSFWASGKAMGFIHTYYTPVQMTGVFFMKKFTAVLLSALLCFSLLGCSNEEKKVTTSSTTAISSTVYESSEKAEEKETEAEKRETTEKKKVTSTSVKSETADKASTSSTVASTTAKSTAKKQAVSSATKASTTKKQTTTSSSITCTVTVECKSILNNMDKLKAGHESYVPADGYIINNCNVTVSNGDTAYDAVKAACDTKGVYLNVTNSSYGKYIAGFNNIDEKDCGSQSGWLYNVNGSYPSKSCSKYILSNGDNVVFTYTCK